MYEESKKRQLEVMLMHAELLPEQKDVLKKFDMESKMQGLTLLTRLNETGKIFKLACRVRKPFLDMKREDIEGFLYGLDLSPATTDLYKIVIKKFFRWLYRTKDFPEIVDWIKLQNNRKRKLPEDILTHNEIKAIIDVADNLRDRALISILYDSGCRLGEIVGIKQKDVTIDQYGAVVMVHGKTGDRRVRLIDSAPDLTLWLNSHPNKGGNKPLFVHERNRDKPLEEMGVYITVRKLARKAGINKKVHPHLFRHTRSTHLAKDFTESELKIMQGWTGGSRMPEIYVHLSGADIDRKRLEKAGLITREEARKEEDGLKARVCPRCKEKNPSTARFCPKCGMVLDLETAVKIDSGKSGMSLEFMDLMQREPRLLEILKNFTNSQGEKKG